MFLSKMIYDVTILIHDAMACWPSDPAVKIKKFKDISCGNSSNVKIIQIGTHTGTHIDAPIHMLSHGASLDDIPLNKLVGNAIVVDIGDAKSISLNQLQRISIDGVKIILFKTKNSQIFPKGKFNEYFIYLEEVAAQYLVNKGIELVGIDGPSIDKYKQPDHPVHQILLGNNVVIIEMLDLSKVMAGVYKITALPLKIKGADGAPARVILESQE
ncbi:cyclase family protein [Candidatus Margulisiibacteriota bacterium]